MEKSDKFSKILSSHAIMEYEITVTHLYSNIGSSFTSGNRYFVYFIPYKSWPLKYIAPTHTGTPLYQTGLGVLSFHPVDMHTLSCKTKKILNFQK
jgi:hypothetical protein